MRAEDFQVQRALIEVGHGGCDVECRGAMYETLEQMLRDDPSDVDGLVDRLRTILSAADRLDEQAELDQAKAVHEGLKACSDCGEKPDIVYSGGFLIVCMNHSGGAVVQSGITLSEAINSWNSVDGTSSSAERVMFPWNRR